MNLFSKKIAVVGLGYVGLPLAVEFAKKYKVVGFDINKKRINELNDAHDATLEVDNQDLKKVLLKKQQSDLSQSELGLRLSNDVQDIMECDIYIITVPTPTDKHNRPDLTPLYRASETVGRVLKQGDIVIYESTVYPGVTEEECVPVLEKASSLQFNNHFFVGYSPERINPGDKEHTLTKILKITSGSSLETSEIVDQLYKSIIIAGTYKAPSIKIAEAAKVIENSQRDINIAFVNELAKIFSLLEIDTNEVLEAAATKWNFLKFKPGLVGGHCIGVDPYYLAQKSQEVGYNPEIILAGRRLNDGMGKYVATEVIKIMIQNGIRIKESKILILGFTFKENCPDVRNTKVIDIVNELKSYKTFVSVVDPWADPLEILNEYDLISLKTVPDEKFDAIVVAVGHNEFKELDLTKNIAANTIIYDVKGIFKKDIIHGRL